MAEVAGYNIGIMLGGKYVYGRTDEDFTSTANVKESITKDDQGSTRRVVIGHDATMSITAIVDTSPEDSSKMSRDDVMELGLKKGSEAVVAFKYLCAGGKTISGNAIVTSVKETSSAAADNSASIQIELQSTGDYAFDTTS